MTQTNITAQQALSPKNMKHTKQCQWFIIMLTKNTPEIGGSSRIFKDKPIFHVAGWILQCYACYAHRIFIASYCIHGITTILRIGFIDITTRCAGPTYHPWVKTNHNPSKSASYMEISPVKWTIYIRLMLTICDAWGPGAHSTKSS